MKRRLILRNEDIRGRAIEAIAALSLELKKPWEVVIRPYSETRSQEQNRAYWAAVQDIARHVGHEPDEIHEIIKLKFLPTSEIDMPDGSYRVVPSTTGLDVGQMSNLIDRVHSWGASLGVEFEHEAWA